MFNLGSEPTGDEAARAHISREIKQWQQGTAGGAAYMAG